MKHGWRFLNSKETKELKAKLKEQFGFEEEFTYAFLINDKNRVFIVNRDIERIDFEKLKINSTGLYFCEDKGNEVRLSIEGSQIVGPHAKKNVIEIDKAAQREWLKGFDLALEGDTDGYVIIRCENDFMGCARHKDGKLLNHVPKERRIRASD